MKSFLISAVAVLAMTLAPPLSAQQPAAGSVDHVTAIKQLMQQSALVLKQYQWVETTIISLKGEEKSRTQKSCSYDAAGQVQKVPIGTPPETKNKPGLRGMIQRNKKEEVSEAVKASVALIHQYVPPDPAKIQSAKDAGKLSIVPPGPEGNVSITITDYLKAGDSMTINANAVTNVLDGVTVSSYTDDKSKDAVGLNVAFAALSNGALYSSKITMDVASQKVTVVVENSDYQLK